MRLLRLRRSRGAPGGAVILSRDHRRRLGRRRAVTVRSARRGRIQGIHPAGRRPPRRYRYPGARHWTRILYGGRLSLITGLISVSFALAIGVPMGVASGYYGGNDRPCAHAGGGPDADVPGHPAGAGDHRGPRPQPAERDDRGRHLRGAHLCARRALDGALGEDRSLHRSGARAGVQQSPHHRAAYPPQHDRTADRLGDAGRRGRHHRRGRAEFSRIWGRNLHSPNGARC